jgi:poly(3-hydroxybutyrate) depolymerase
MRLRWFTGLFLSIGCATAAPATVPPLDAGGVPAADGAPATGGPEVADGAVVDGPVGAEAAAMDDAPPAAPGCGTAGAPTGVQRKSLTVDGRARSYLLSVPAGYRADAPIPLVFAWHGLGGSAAYFRGAHGLEGPAQGGAIFVYPDGLPQPAFANNAGWDLRPDGPDVHLFDAMLAEVTGTYCVDRARVFSTGHSFGGYMTNTLGCLRGSVLRGIAPVSGGLPMLKCDGKAMPAWLTHGSNDPVVAFSEGESARDHWRMGAGCGETSRPVEPAGCVAYDGCGAPVHWCVHQLMHSWPPFASAAIWRFFRELK